MVNRNNLRSSRAGGRSTSGQSSSFTNSEEHRSLMQIVGEIANKPSLTISAEKIRKDVVKSFKQSEKEGLEMSSFRLSLIDPISKKRVRIPVRSVNCDHFQCFDLHNFLDFSFGNANREGDEGKSAWCCPHCQAEAKQEQLRVDGYFQEILMKVGPIPLEMEIFPDGQWKEVEQIDFKDVFPTDKNDEVVVIVPNKKPRISDEGEPGEVSEAASSHQPEANQSFLFKELRQILGVAPDQNLIETVQKLKQDSDFVVVLCEIVGIDKDSEGKYNTIIEVFKELLMNQKKGEVKAHKASQTLEMQKDDGNELLADKLPTETRGNSSSSLSAVDGAPSNKSSTAQIVASGEKQLFWTREDFEDPANWTKGRSKTTGLDYYFNAATTHSLFEADIPPELLAKIRELEKIKAAQIHLIPSSSLSSSSSAEQNHHQNRKGQKESAPAPKMLHLSSQFSTTSSLLHNQQKTKNNSEEEEEKEEKSPSSDGGGEEISPFDSRHHGEEVPANNPEEAEEIIVEGAVDTSSNDFRQNTEETEPSPFQLRLAHFERRMKEGKLLHKPNALKNNASTENGGTRYWIQIKWPVDSHSPFKRNDQWKSGEIQLLLWECFSVVCHSVMHFNAKYVLLSLKSIEDAEKVVSGLNGLTYFGCKLAVRPKGGQKEAKKYGVVPTLPPSRKRGDGGRSPNQSPGFASKRIFWPPPPSSIPLRMPENSAMQRPTTNSPQKTRFFGAPPPSSGAASSSNSVRPQRPGLLPTPNSTTSSKSLLGEGPTAVPPRFNFFGGPQHQTNKNISSNKRVTVFGHGFPFESGGFFNTPSSVNLTMPQNQKQPPSQHSRGQFDAASSSSFSIGGHPRPYQ